MTKQRSILFSAPMIHALLDCAKTQTRRICKHAVDANLSIVIGPFDLAGFGGGWFGDEEGEVQFLGPYGRPGERLWVRETFYAYGRWVTRYSEKKSRDEWHFIDMTVECDRAYQYAADSPDLPLATGRGGVLPGWHKRPAIFMPRAACRIELEITGVRVERLNNCSAANARAEGLIRYEYFWRDSEYPLEDVAYEPFEASPVRYSDPVAAYAALWESINGVGSWAANPWVWVVDFKRVAP